jgi:CheY-like chemotaxis protein
MNMVLVRGLLTRIFPDCEIVEAKNGKEAVSLYSQMPIDIVLMDVHMPEMDGNEATLHIRSYEQNHRRRTPIIALSAGAFTEERERALAAGMDDFLTKPVEAGKLQTVLCRYLTKEEAI